MGTVKLWLTEAGRRRSTRAASPPPTFYMNDWSELALRVSALKPARAILREQSVGIVETPCGVVLHFPSLAHIPRMVALLNRNGVKADLSDRIGDGAQVYQG